MEIIFLEAKSDADVSNAVEQAIKFLPKKVGIITTSQHMHKLKEIQEILKKHKITAEIAGQILGCDASAASKIKNKVDAFLYVGSGRFHPIEVQLETEKKVVMANPLANEAKVLEKEYSEKIEKQQKGALLKFLSSKSIGILASTKPGQNKLKKAFELKDKIKGKKCYIFIADTIDTRELENFPFIECWVNTACPRLTDNLKGVVNYKLVEKHIQER